MSSGPIVNRKKSVDEILSLIRTQSTDLARAVAEFFAPDLREGEEPPDFVLFQNLVARALERRLGELFHADDAWHRKLTVERRLRRELSKILAPFRRKVKAIRHGGRLVYEAESDKASSLFHGELPRDADSVVALALNLLVWLEDPELEDQLVFPLKNKRRAIREGAEEVKEALERLDTGKVDTLMARLERKQVLKAFNEDFVHLAGLVESLCGLSGNEKWKKLVMASKQEKGLLVSVVRRRRTAMAARPDAEAS